MGWSVVLYSVFLLISVRPSVGPRPREKVINNGGNGAAVGRPLGREEKQDSARVARPLCGHTMKKNQKLNGVYY